MGRTSRRWWVLGALACAGIAAAFVLGSTPAVPGSGDEIPRVQAGARIPAGDAMARQIPRGGESL